MRTPPYFGWSNKAQQIKTNDGCATWKILVGTLKVQSFKLDWDAGLGSTVIHNCHIIVGN